MKLNIDGCVVRNIWEVGQPSVAVCGKYLFGKAFFWQPQFLLSSLNMSVCLHFRNFMEAGFFLAILTTVSFRFLQAWQSVCISVSMTSWRPVSPWPLWLSLAYNHGFQSFQSLVYKQKAGRGCASQELTTSR